MNLRTFLFLILDVFAENYFPYVRDMFGISFPEILFKRSYVCGNYQEGLGAELTVLDEPHTRAHVL